jgi:hypothetical protein
MTELEEKIALIRVKRAVKNTLKNQVTFADMSSIVRWQLRDRGNFSVADTIVLMNYQKKYN